MRPDFAQVGSLREDRKRRGQLHRAHCASFTFRDEMGHYGTFITEAWRCAIGLMFVAASDACI